MLFYLVCVRESVSVCVGYLTFDLAKEKKNFAKTRHDYGKNRRSSENKNVFTFEVKLDFLIDIRIVIKDFGFIFL